MPSLLSRRWNTTSNPERALGTPRFKAMREVSGPVVAIALILASVFVPMAFMSGIQGRLNKQFAVTVAISVIISAFNALTLAPALSAMLLRPRKAVRGPLGAFFRGFNRAFDKLKNTYVDVSHSLVRKASIGVLILAAFAAADAWVGRKLPTSFLPDEDYGFLFHECPASSRGVPGTERMRLPQGGADLSRSTPGGERCHDGRGVQSAYPVSTTNSAFYFVTLKPWDERSAAGWIHELFSRKINGQLHTQVPGSRRLCVQLRRRFRGLGIGRLYALATGPQRRHGGDPR